MIPMMMIPMMMMMVDQCCCYYFVASAAVDSAITKHAPHLRLDRDEFSLASDE